MTIEKKKKVKDFRLVDERERKRIEKRKKWRMKHPPFVLVCDIGKSWQWW